MQKDRHLDTITHVVSWHSYRKPERQSTPAFRVSCSIPLTQHSGSPALSVLSKSMKWTREVAAERLTPWNEQRDCSSHAQEEGGSHLMLSPPTAAAAALAS